jgi:ribulose-phosphate 3-epimerase
VEPYLGEIDLLLCMTVFPGFPGQAFIDDVVPKIAEARAAVDSRGLAVSIEVDGGIDTETAPRTAAAGARVFVAGAAIFDSPDPAAAVEALRDAVAAVIRAEPSQTDRKGA